jgi:hypothetical protein
MKYLVLISFLILSSGLMSQNDNGEKITGFYFGPKAGLTIANQNWDGYQRRPLFNYHGAIFMEGFDPYYRGSMFMQLGYQSRGSSLTINNLSGGFNFAEGIVFNNLAVTVGAKKRLLITSISSTPYYYVGVRAEYNVSNNTADIQQRYSSSAASLFYPFPEYVNDFVYGITFGGGFEFVGSEFVFPAIEFTISPDLSNQYFSPEISPVVNPFNGQSTTLQERRIRNVTFEISLILKFKREVILVDR